MTRSLCASILVVGLLAASPARAVTGAQYLQQSEEFAIGYSWGILNFELFAGFANEPPAIANSRVARQECFIQSGIQPIEFHQAIVQKIQSDALYATEPAFVAIVDVALEMCPVSR